MGPTVKSFQNTPNPNAVKCILDRKIADEPRSYLKAADAAADPLGSRLFAIDGVTNILIHSDWITIGKRPEAQWKPIKAALERVLHEGA